MKKSLGLAAVFGVAVLLALPVTGQAAAIDNNSGMTTAEVGLTQDPNGQIMLTQAPSFNFGSGVLTAEEMTLTPVTTDELTVANPSLNTGWRVEVSATPFVDDDTSFTLNSTDFTINGIVSPEDTKNPSVYPTNFSVDVNPKPQVVLQAEKNTGLGIWHDSYSEGNATLTVPGGNQPGSYSSTMTWTLSSLPEE
ncbi:WxL domain-containing protein [Lactiplantibacillus sp. WILCCON 0030]|uniref:WxL domain-containing protein n=1 Tax=Lactiplantibacillus brownii TaxID=3069269 RepID=A0ABU1A7N1_9LACO|nr:WxL domain-containing protein [Lactiplantibacillus brownii]MDQ7936350.1 WxL domain-containing protein [Lactiplantibacillus brownii]